MNSTDQVRQWYHKGVVINHASRGNPGFTPLCNHTVNIPKMSFPREGGGYYLEPVHPLTVEAWKAYVYVMEVMGVTITGAGGVDSCRNIGDTDWPSLHAYLLALDNPPNERKSQAFINKILLIRTKDGAPVFRNLASVNDRMHDEINCSPANLKSGIDWSTVYLWENDMPFLPMKSGDGGAKNPEKKEDVRLTQRRLNAVFKPDPALKLDGIYGPAVEAVMVKHLGGKVMNAARWDTLDKKWVKLQAGGGSGPITLDVKTVEVVKSVSIK